MSPFCDFTTRLDTSSSARDWARATWGCLVKVAVKAIQSIYGGSRSNAPLESECQEFDRRAFGGQEECLRADLCQTQFTFTDASAVANVLESSGVFRDRSFEQMLDLLTECGEDNQNVAPLRDEMLKRGFVFCFTVPSEGAKAAFLNLLKQILDILSINMGGGGGAGGGGAITELANADELCFVRNSRVTRRSISGRLKRNTHNDTEPVVVAVLSNGTTTVSQASLCDDPNIAPNLTLECPSCGDGVLHLATEVCDDGNEDPGDGCSPTCTVENGYGCNTVPDQRSQCYEQICGDGIRVPGEDCDTGGEAGCNNCTLSAGFACSINPPFGTSVCSECGNGVVDIGEECDNGLSVQPDGCNNTCHQLPYFECYGNVSEIGTCRHFDIDLDKFDNTTRNRSLVFFRSGQVVFLVDDRAVDASDYGDEVSCRTQTHDETHYRLNGIHHVMNSVSL